MTCSVTDFDKGNRVEDGCRQCLSLEPTGPTVDLELDDRRSWHAEFHVLVNLSIPHPSDGREVAALVDVIGREKKNCLGIEHAVVVTGVEDGWLPVVRLVVQDV